MYWFWPERQIRFIAVCRPAYSLPDQPPVIYYTSETIIFVKRSTMPKEEKVDRRKYVGAIGGAAVGLGDPPRQSGIPVSGQWRAGTVEAGWDRGRGREALDAVDEVGSAVMKEGRGVP